LDIGGDEMKWNESTKKPIVNTDVLAKCEGMHFVCQWNGEQWIQGDQIVSAPSAWADINEQFEKGQPVYVTIFQSSANVMLFDRVDDDGSMFVIGEDGNPVRVMAVYKTKSEAQSVTNKLSQIVTEFFSKKQ
jgi:hypothetical protein